MLGDGINFSDRETFDVAEVWEHSILNSRLALHAAEKCDMAIRCETNGSDSHTGFGLSDETAGARVEEANIPVPASEPASHGEVFAGGMELERFH